ncbi:hypothetical protein ACIP5Y_20545 [Nocardia sp. NPDC088792]|uniref:hypothetical protein n=1 Tax=Nocardia sp. NPDC088792 TaxID=3364332 RepID=UPI0037F9D773
MNIESGNDTEAMQNTVAAETENGQTPVRDIPPADGGAPGAGELQRLREQWREAQGHFVDDPREAVSQADELVEQALRQLTASYAQRRETIENGWSHGENTDTEALRQALRGYRDLFDQLVGTASGATNI